MRIALALAAALLLVWVALHVTVTWPFYGALLLSATTRALAGPASKSLAPLLVPREQFELVPKLAAQLGNTNLLGIASSMNIGGHLVDVSPLSTIGALCIAAASSPTESRNLFNKMLAWGLSMSVVGALLCYLMF